MSRTYRCKVKKDVAVHVDTRDRVVYKVRINDILSEEETNDLLRQKLADKGGEVDGEGKVTLEVDGVELEVDPDSREAVAKTGGQETVEKGFDGEKAERSWDDDRAEAQRQAEARVEAELKREAEREAGERVEQARRRLGDARDKIVGVLREASAETEKEAVLRKAERMGRVLGVHESEDEKSGDKKVVIDLEIPE